MATAEELRQILKEDQNGQNLYDHLTETLMRILIDRPKNAFEAFELISAHVKSNPLSPEPAQGRPLPLCAEQLNQQLEWARKSSSLLKVPDEAPEDSGVKVQDLLDDASLLSYAGVSLGTQGDLYRLFLSLKHLAETLSGDNDRVRLFGRISTRSLPYYVAETLSAEDEEGVDERKQEGRSGANKYAYYVTQNVESGVWVKLPNVTMKQVVVARQIKRLLTGNLDAAVPSFPPFPGTERHLLRALVALIAGDTSVSPDGFFELDDSEPPAVKPAEAESLNEKFPKPALELKDAEAWKHHETPLNALGRVLALPEREEGEPVPEGEGEGEGEPVEANPPLDSLKPELWSLRVAPGGAGVSASSVCVARSLRWPGAVSVYAKRQFVCVYVGNALCASMEGESYAPPLPAALQSEFVVSGAGGAGGAAEGEGEGAAKNALLEAADVKVDPTPPVPEGEAEEE